MQTLSIVPALNPVVEVFQRIDVDYYIGGSIASSNCGVPRTTMDIDVVADLDGSHVEPMVRCLNQDYYIDKDVIIQALKRKSSFNLIHFETMIKIDVFILKDRPYDREAFKRRKKDTLVIDGAAPGRQYFFSSEEDIIINKLEWFKMGGEVSERQWNDIRGVLQVQKNSIDLPYLKEWTETLGLADLLSKVLEEID